MFKKIIVRGFVGLVVLIALFAGFVALQPSDYRVERKATIAAPPSAVFAQVNDFHKWDAWSPWAKLDPNATTKFEVAEAGKGAIFRWAGNDDIGEGSMTITDSVPNELVKLKLEFIKPYPGTSDTVFTFKPQGDQTEVTWAMSGKNNFVGKAICVFMNMDKMVGAKFDEGLANMKSVVESAK